MQILWNKSTFDNSYNLDYLELEFQQIGISCDSITEDATNIILEHNTTSLDQLKNIYCLLSMHTGMPEVEIDLRKINLDCHCDYQKIRNQLKVLAEAKGFENMSSLEKEFSAKYCLFDDTTIVTYYMGQGLSLPEAKTEHLFKRAVDINNAAIACANRLDSPIAIYIIIKYLGQEWGLKFKEACSDYYSDLRGTAHHGTQYGENKDGHMDYVEETGSHVNDQGVSQLPFQNGYTLAEFQAAYKDYFYYGNIPSSYLTYV